MKMHRDLKIKMINMKCILMTMRMKIYMKTIKKKIMMKKNMIDIEKFKLISNSILLCFSI